MTARAIVTRYNDEVALVDGNFQITAYFLITDPAAINDGSGRNPRVMAANGIVLDAAAPGTWAATIENAVIAAGVAAGFTDLVAVNVFIPTIA